MSTQALGYWLLGAVSVVIAMLGLFLASRAVDVGFSVFGYLLFLFGVLFVFALIKRGSDAADTGQAEGDAQSSHAA